MLLLLCTTCPVGYHRSATDPGSVHRFVQLVVDGEIQKARNNKYFIISDRGITKYMCKSRYRHYGGNLSNYQIIYKVKYKMLPKSS